MTKLRSYSPVVESLVTALCLSVAGCGPSARKGAPHRTGEAASPVGGETGGSQSQQGDVAFALDLPPNLPPSAPVPAKTNIDAALLEAASVETPSTTTMGKLRGAMSEYTGATKSFLGTQKTRIVDIVSWHGGGTEAGGSRAIGDRLKTVDGLVNNLTAKYDNEKDDYVDPDEFNQVHTELGRILDSIAELDGFLLKELQAVRDEELKARKISEMWERFANPTDPADHELQRYLGDYQKREPVGSWSTNLTVQEAATVMREDLKRRFVAARAKIAGLEQKLRDAKAVLPTFEYSGSRVKVKPAYVLSDLPLDKVFDSFMDCAEGPKAPGETDGAHLKRLLQDLVNAHMTARGMSTLPQTEIDKLRNQFGTLRLNNAEIMSDAGAAFMRAESAKLLYRYLDKMVFIKVSRSGTTVNVHPMCKPLPAECTQNVYYLTPDVLNVLFKRKYGPQVQAIYAGASGSHMDFLQKNWDARLRPIQDAMWADVGRALGKIDDVMKGYLVIAKGEIVKAVEQTKQVVIAQHAITVGNLVGKMKQIPMTVRQSFDEAGLFGRYAYFEVEKYKKAWFAGRALVETGNITKAAEAAVKQDSVLQLLVYLGKYSTTALELRDTWAKILASDKIPEIQELQAKSEALMRSLIQQITVQEGATDPNLASELNLLLEKIDSRRELVKSGIVTTLTVAVTIGTAGTGTPLIVGAFVMTGSHLAATTLINTTDVVTGRPWDKVTHEMAVDAGMSLISGASFLATEAGAGLLLARAGFVNRFAAETVLGRSLKNGVVNAMIGGEMFIGELYLNQGRLPSTKSDFERMATSMLAGGGLGFGFTGMIGVGQRAMSMRTANLSAADKQKLGQAFGSNAADEPTLWLDVAKSVEKKTLSTSPEGTIAFEDPEIVPLVVRLHHVAKSHNVLRPAPKSPDFVGLQALPAEGDKAGIDVIARQAAKQEAVDRFLANGAVINLQKYPWDTIRADHLNFMQREGALLTVLPKNIRERLTEFHKAMSLPSATRDADVDKLILILDTVNKRSLNDHPVQMLRVMQDKVEDRILELEARYLGKGGPFEIKPEITDPVQIASLKEQARELANKTQIEEFAVKYGFKPKMMETGMTVDETFKELGITDAELAAMNIYMPSGIQITRIAQVVDQPEGSLLAFKKMIERGYLLDDTILADNGQRTQQAHTALFHMRQQVYVAHLVEELISGGLLQPADRQLVSYAYRATQHTHLYPDRLDWTGTGLSPTSPSLGIFTAPPHQKWRQEGLWWFLYDDTAAVGYLRSPEGVAQALCPVGVWQHR